MAIQVIQRSRKCRGPSSGKISAGHDGDVATERVHKMEATANTSVSILDTPGADQIAAGDWREGFGLKSVAKALNHRHGVRCRAALQEQVPMESPVRALCSREKKKEGELH